MSEKFIEIPKNMEENFNEEIKEILVITSDYGASAGTSPNSDYWTAHTDILAYIEDDKLINCKGSLAWAITNEEADKGSFYNRFSKCCIYKIRGRHLKTNEEINKWNNQWYVLEVIESNLHNKELEEILAEYQKPVTITDNVLGELELDKDLNILEGVAVWGNDEIEISIDIDDNDTNSVIDTCKKIFSQHEKWDKEARKIAADKLTDTANDWAADADDDWTADDDEIHEITKDEFAKRLEITTLSIESDNSFSIYFDDDDMFFGHCIIVEGTLTDGVQDAYLAG